MQFLRQNLALAVSAAVVLSAASTATAAVVQAPSDVSASSAIWDEHAIVERSFDGLGLVYDIIDVTGFATGDSEFDCANCEVAFSGLHESFSAGGARAGGGLAGGSGFGGPWKKTDYAKPGGSPKTNTTSNNSHPGNPNNSKSNGSGGGAPADASEPSGLQAPPSLTTNEVPPAGEAPQTFVVPPSVIPTDESTTTTGTADDTGGGDGGGSTGSGAAVPEPGSIFLLGTGMLGLAAAVRRRLKR